MKSSIRPLVLSTMVLVGIATASSGQTVPTTAAAAAPGTFVNLGPQITNQLIQGSTFAKDPSGRDLICSVMRGQTGRFLAFDVRTGQVVADQALETTSGSWSTTTATDGSVYSGSDTGHVYRWIPGTNEVKDLGICLPGERFVFDLCAGENGEVFGGTYAGARLWRYHPDTGFKAIGDEAVVPKENYVRSIAYDPSTKTIYAGVGSHAHLVAVDVATGKKTELLPKEYAGYQAVNGVDVINGRVYARMINGNETIVLNAKTGALEAKLPFVSGTQFITGSPDAPVVYYMGERYITAWDPEKPGEAPRQIVPCNDGIAIGWLAYDNEPDYPGRTLVGLSRGGGFVRWNSQTKKSSTVQLQLPRIPTPIQSISNMADGRLWIGGYLAGGTGIYDPETGKTENRRGMSQTESAVCLGDKMYFGVYPRGRFYEYDTRRPWDFSKRAEENNPRLIAATEEQGQSRPMAALAVPELNKVFFGTVSDYGKLPGALSVYDVASKTCDVHVDVVHNQSVVSLAFCKGLVVGGTTVTPGLGSQATEKEAKLFVWDPATNEKVFESVPVPGAMAITGLMVGPDGNVWGWANAHLIVFDPARRELVYAEKLLDEKPRGAWRDAYMVQHPNGLLYAVNYDKLFSIDPATKKVTILRDKEAGCLAMDRKGRLYFRHKGDMWQYTP
jgi:outer membrane protein assembly factor BamB